MIRILIVDDSESVLEGLAALLNAEPEFEVVGLARTGREAVEGVSASSPHVVVMDVQMPEMDGIEATRRIKQMTPEVGVLVLTVFADYMEASIAAGAEACLLKDCDPEELVATLKGIAASKREVGASARQKVSADDAGKGTRDGDA